MILKVKSMMYGFGDDENPYQESVEVLEDLVIHFIQYMVDFSLNHHNQIKFYQLAC